MRRRHTLTLMGAAATLLLAGCDMPRHNDVLIFGTDTKVALDLSTDIANANAPSMTLGYKRREAVWMPLSMGRDAPDPACNIVAQDSTCEIVVVDGRKYVAIPESGKGRDSYSVFASFGLKNSVSAGSVSSDLAQFIATGVAAQRLAEKESITKALTAKPADVVKAEAADVGNAALLGALSPDALKAALEAGGAAARQQKADAALIAQCAKLDTPAANMGPLLAAAQNQGLATNDPSIEDLQAVKSRTELEFALQFNAQAVKPLAKARVDICS